MTLWLDPQWARDVFQAVGDGTVCVPAYILLGLGTAASGVIGSLYLRMNRIVDAQTDRLQRERDALADRVMEGVPNARRPNPR